MSPVDPAAADLAVVGAGPAGRSLAVAAARAGLRVLLVDPAPDRRWGATYGAFRADLPAGVPIAARLERPRVRTDSGGLLDAPGAYDVLDTAALQDGLALDGVRVVADRAVALLTSGVRTPSSSLPARVVVDARGTPTAGRTVQTALGVVVPSRTAAPLLDGAAGLFMDWRRDHGRAPTAEPTFCYAVPVGDDRVLLEETSLAARPGPRTGELRARLQARLAHHGITLRGDEDVEHVRFALDRPLGSREWGGAAPAVVRIGAAAPVVHPATGYSVAASLSLAPRLAAVVADGGDARDVHRVLWSAPALAVHAMRLRGLRALVGFDAAETDRFFTAFFALPTHRQRAYLSGRRDLAGTARAMAGMLPHLDRDMRRRLVGAAVAGR